MSKAKNIRQGKAALVERMGNRFPMYRIDLDDLSDATHQRGYLLSLEVERFRHEGALWFDLTVIARGEDCAGQTDSVLRSNFRSLIRDYGSYGTAVDDGDPCAFLPVSYTNVNSLGVLARDLTDDIVDTLIHLRDVYAIYDEDDLSALESEEIHAAWDQYMRADVSSVIQDIDESAWDVWAEMDEGLQRDIFWDAQLDHDYYPEHSGLDIHWETEAIAGWIADRIGPWARVWGDPGRCIAAGTETLF